MQNRSGYVDLLKAFAIFAVLIGHSVQYVHTSISCLDHPLWSLIYSFHMPLFAYIGGYFSITSSNKCFLEMFCAKFVRLILPAITISFLFSFCRYLVTHDPSQIGTGLLRRCVFQFWFLKSLFCCSMILYLCKRLFPNMFWISLVFPLICVLVCPYGHVFHLNFMFPCFEFGLVCRAFAGQIEKKQDFFVVLSGATFLFLLLFWSGRFTVYVAPFCLIRWNPFSIGLTNWGAFVFRLVIGFSGSMFFFLLARILFANIKAENCIAAVGRETLGIYVLQYFVLERTLPLLSVSVSLLSSYFLAFAIAFVYLVGCHTVVGIVRRQPMLRLFFLGERRL